MAGTPSSRLASSTSTWPAMSGTWMADGSQVGYRRLLIATGGYASLMAARLPEIDAVRPHLTLEGLRIIGNLNR